MLGSDRGSFLQPGVSLPESVKAGVPVSAFPRSMALFAAAREVIPGGVTSSIRAGSPAASALLRARRRALSVGRGRQSVRRLRPRLRTAHPRPRAAASCATRSRPSSASGPDVRVAASPRTRARGAPRGDRPRRGAGDLRHDRVSEAVAAALRLARVVTGRRPRPQVRGPLPRLARRRVRQHRRSTRSGPARPTHPATVPATAGIPEARARGRRRRAMERRRLGRGDPEASIPGERRGDHVRAGRRQRRPDPARRRVPRGAPVDWPRATERCSCSTKSSPGSGVALGGAQERLAIDGGPGDLRQGDRRRHRPERGDRLARGHGPDRRRTPGPQRNVQRQPDRHGRPACASLRHLIGRARDRIYPSSSVWRRASRPVSRRRRRG